MRVGSLNGFSASFQDRVLIQRLKMQGERTLPDAVAEALNETADAITMRSRLNVQRRLTVRTQFTVNSIRTKNRARGRNAARMFARTGTISKYLPIQNVGGEIRANRRRMPIPTREHARGGSNRNVVRRRYRMDRLGSIKNSSRYFMGSGPSGKMGIWQRDGRRLKMIRDLSQQSVRIEPTNWFTDAIDEIAPTVNQRFKRAADRRL